MLAIDLDGTLLQDEFTVSSFSAKTIEDYEKAGYLIVLASGRPYRSIKPFYEQMHLKGPLICYNGGLCFHPQDESFPTLRFVFEVKRLRELSAQLSPYCPVLMAETDNAIFATAYDESLARYFWFDGMHVVYGDMKDILHFDPYTFLMGCPDEHRLKIEQVIQRFQGFSQRHWGDRPYCELYFEDGNKGTCLRHIAKHYGIPKEKIYAFGDGINDMCMLEEAGHPFAVKGCKSPVLAANFPSTKESNLADGVAKTLLEILPL